MPQAVADPVADLLMKAPPPVRADAWDAFHTAKNADEFATAIKAMPIADSVKADLWDLKQKQSAVPDFKQTDTTPNEVDPNTLGTAVSHYASGVNPVAAGQLLPFPKALGGSGMDHPLAVDGTQQFAPNFLKQMHAVKAEGDARWAKGDHIGAISKYVESIIPLAGPGMSHLGNQLEEGKYAAAAGDVGALITNLLLGKIGGGSSAARMGEAESTDAVGFAKARGVPLDAATASDNLAVKGVQQLADRSIGGSLVATPANAARAEAMSRVGGDLAAETGAAATTPEQAGTGLRQAMTQKVAGHAAAADAAYDSLRTLEEQPANRMNMPLKPQAVDALRGEQTGQLRRIVHELDASGYVKGKSIDANPGVDSSSYYSAGSGGAKVFDDIVARMGGTSTPTRGVVQNQIETYLGGGPETNIVKAALEVADARTRGQRGNFSTPELPTSAMSVPTRLEASRVTSEEMGLPVSLAAPKAALRPLYEQMKRQMPITQQQANPGLKAIENILTGPDYGPISQIDRDLGAIKAVARQHGGLAKMAVSKLESAVSEAAQNGGPDVVAALQKGRKATIDKYAATEVLDSLNDEPVKTVRALTAPKDAGIQQLRTVAQQVPQQTPEIARAYLEDLLEKPNKVAEWNKLGSQTKAILFPKAGQAQALDNFFALTKRISDTNVNPSGSGHQALLGAQGAMLWYDPLHAGALQIGGAVLAKLLRSPAAITALTRGLTLPAAAPAVVRAAATANLLRAAHSAGVVLDFPKAAESPASPGGPR